jgi:CHAT domain-containing protein
VGIFEAIGGSVAFEECKGDFVLAKQIAEAELAAARQTGDSSALADPLIGVGIVHLLQGEPLAAIERFDAVLSLTPCEDRHRLRAASYRHWAVYLRFNIFPGGAGSNSAEVSVRWQGVPYAQEEHPRWQALLNKVTDPGTRLEAWLVHQVLPNLLPARAMLESRRFAPAVPEVAQMLENTLQGLANFRAAIGSFPYGDLAAADLCNRAGRRPESREYLKKAREGYEQAGDAAGTATCDMTRGDWLAAPFSSPLVMNFLLAEGSSEGSDLGWQSETEEANREGLNPAEARDAYDEAERLFARARAPRGLAAITLRRAWLAAVNDDFQNAAKLAEQASAALEECGDLAGGRLAQIHLAIYRVGAEHGPAAVELTTAVGEWGEEGGSFSFALGLGLLVNRAARHWLTRRGDFGRAEKCQRLAQALFAALRAPSNSAQCLIDRGRAHQAVSDYPTALTLYEQALDAMAEAIHVEPALAGALRRRIIMLAASAYCLCQQQRDPDGMARNARRLEAQAAVLPEESDNVSAIDAMQENLFANISAGDADLPSAVEQFSLTSLGRSTLEHSKVLVPLYRATAARDRGMQADAERLFEEALDAARGASEGQRHFLEATVLGTWGKQAAAVAAFDRHLAAGGANAGFPGILGKIISGSGGKFGEAEQRVQQIRTHKQAFAFFARNKAWERARVELSALERMDGEEWWKREERPWEELCSRGEVHEGLGNLPAALRSYNQAMSELEARRKLLTRDELKSAFAGNRNAQYVYFLAARAAMKSGDRAGSFRYVENGKARALLDLMAATVPSGRLDTGSSDESLRHWRELNARLALTRGLLAQARNADQPNAAAIEELTERVTAVEEQLHGEEKDLAERYPAFEQVFSTAAHTLSLDETAATLPPRAALLQYAFLGDHLLGWAITREGMVETVLVSLETEALERQIRTFHRACARRADIGGVDEELARTLLAPFAATIREHTQIIVVPYGTAHLLPFHALPFDGQPLAERHAVSYLPSASILQFLPDAARPAPTSILAVGNPTGNLPAATVEAQFVASLYGQSALVGAEATEENVRREIASHRLLHFATHGRLSVESPLSSSIVLARGDELTVYELMGLRLDVDLVVLSACETGRGEVTGGDDVLGLTRALLAAGARAALVSLWPVDDLSTSIFMGEFYRRLRAGDSASNALQAAEDYLRNPDQEKRRAALAEALSHAAPSPGGDSVARHFRTDDVPAKTDDFRHQYYWAPFVLIGRGWS